MNQHIRQYLFPQIETIIFLETLQFGLFSDHPFVQNESDSIEFHGWWLVINGYRSAGVAVVEESWL